MEEHLYLTLWDIEEENVCKSLKRESIFYIEEIDDYRVVPDDNDLIKIQFSIEKKSGFGRILFSSLKFYAYPCFYISIDFLEEQGVWLDNAEGQAYLYLTGINKKIFKMFYHLTGEYCCILPDVKNNDIYNFIASNSCFSFIISFNAKLKKYDSKIEHDFDTPVRRLMGIYSFYSPLLDNNDKNNLISMVNTLASRKL